MHNWLVGRHNEVYRIVNAHNWSCLVNYNEYTWALGCEHFKVSLRIVEAAMSEVCTFSKKPSLCNMQEDLKKTVIICYQDHNSIKSQRPYHSLSSHGALY